MRAAFFDGAYMLINRWTCSFVALAALSACSAYPDVHATSATGDSAHARGGLASGDTPPRAQSSGGEIVGGRSSVKPPGKPADTLGAHLLPGRNAHDNSSFLGAIRAGARMIPKWPTPPTPLSGSLLPARRIVAFYGNPLSTKMGVLGEYPVDQMLAKLNETVAEWRAADPSTPVQPALHLITVVAQGAPGKDGMYRLRMDSSLIEKVYGWAQREHALLFLDVQVGKSTLQAELPRLVPFLSRPDVHLGIDPEFSMHYEREGMAPGHKIGEMDAADVNYAVHTLEQVVSEHHLPPKVLIVHRFTQKMVSNSSKIDVDPRVQVVMNMDGWGPPWLKFDSYAAYEVDQPVEYTGFKIFFHNDVKSGERLLTPAEVLHLLPRPLYIQYQ